MFTENANRIFNRSIEEYHRWDDVDHPIDNPYAPGTIDHLLYHKNWIDTVQWHLEDIIRDPAIDPAEALLIKRRIDKSNQDRTDMVEYVDSYLLDKYKGLGKVRAFLIYVLCDETFSLVSTLEPPEGVARRDFYFWISLLDYLYWITGTALGGLLGSFLTFDTTGLDFALTALFVVLFLEQWKKPENRPAGVMGILCAAASLAVFGADNMVIPAMVLVLAVLLGARRRLDRSGEEGDL